MKISIAGTGTNCKIGRIDNAWLRILTNTEPTGILQENADLGNFAYIVFAENGRYGEIRMGLNEYKTNGMDLIVQKMREELPLSATPTGEALWEAYNYLKQSNDHNYSVLDCLNNNNDYEKLIKYIRGQDFTDAQSPITAKVEIGKCFNKYYLFFGTGRWLYKADNSLPGQKNRLYGIPLVCDTNGNCSPNINVASNPSDVCTDAQNNVLRGWYIELDLENNDYYKERNITEPVLTNQNVVLFTTIEPTKDPCKFGGRTRIWALNCATGGSIVDNCPVYNIDLRTLQGSTLLQLSGGNIQQINIKELANQQQTNNTKTTEWFTVTAPEGAPSFVYPAPQTKGEILLWLER